VNDQPGALPADQRPFDDTPVHTADLPETPIRDRNIPAEAWVEAPLALLSAGDDLGEVRIAYKRRLGAWLLWRAGPGSRRPLCGRPRRRPGQGPDLPLTPRRVGVRGRAPRGHPPSVPLLEAGSPRGR